MCYSKVIIWKIYKNAFLVQSGDQKWVTVIDTISTQSKALEPMIIFKGKLIHKAWQKAYPEAVFEVSNNG